MQGHVKVTIKNPDGSIAAQRLGKNLITDAPRRLLSPPSTWLMGLTQFYSGDYYSQLLPVSTKLFGGILLWSSPLPEDVNTLIPPNPFDQVGHAGTPYAGDSVRRGSYNNLESGAVEGGYKHVWDFNTNQANGVITAISATTPSGGDIGWNPDPEVAKTEEFQKLLRTVDRGDSYPGVEVIKVYETGVDNSTQMCIGRQGNYLYYGYRNGASIVVWKMGINPDRIDRLSLMQGSLALSYGGRVSIEEYNFTLERTPGHPMFWHMTSTEILIPAYISPTQFYLCRINLNTMQVASENTITVPSGGSFGSNSAYAGVRIDESYLYIRSTPTVGGYSETAWKVDLNNLANIVEVPLSIHTNNQLTSFSSKPFSLTLPNGIAICSDSPTLSDPGRLSYGEMSIPYKFIRGSAYCFTKSYTDENLLPFLQSVFYRDSFYFRLNMAGAYLTNVLTSVYNLPAPVVKSPGQTMKIEYTFLEGDGA